MSYSFVMHDVILVTVHSYTLACRSTIDATGKPPDSWSCCAGLIDVTSDDGWVEGGFITNMLFINTSFSPVFHPSLNSVTTVEKMPSNGNKETIKGSGMRSKSQVSDRDGGKCERKTVNVSSFLYLVVLSQRSHHRWNGPAQISDWVFVSIMLSMQCNVIMQKVRVHQQ